MGGVGGGGGGGLTVEEEDSLFTLGCQKEKGVRGRNTRYRKLR